MPTYGYECSVCKDKFEVIQKITEDALTVHEGCGGTLRRLLYPVGIVFKGSGFHVNDYARKSSGEGTESGDAKPEAKTDVKAEAKTESKPESKTESTTESKTDPKPAAASAS